MTKNNTSASYLMKLLVGALLLGALTVCAGEQDDELWGVNTRSERVKLDPSKICWSTLDPIPTDVVVVPDPVNNRFVYRKLQGAEAKSTSDVTGSISNTIEIIVDDSNNCTCECSTGHCDPALFQGSCVCIIRDGCSTCTKK